MGALPSDDHAYFLRRSAHHRLMADQAEAASSKMAHGQFADAYALRAAQSLVQED